MSGQIAAKTTIKIDLAVAPSVLGRQYHSFLVSDSLTRLSSLVCFTFFCIRNAYIRFPGLPDLPSPDLNIGFCYVDPAKKYSTVFPLEIENIAETNLTISVSSNLAQQCFIFTDPSLAVSVSDIFLNKHEKQVLYICLQPYVTGKKQESKQAISSSGLMNTTPSPAVS